MADLSVRLRILAESAQANADLRRMQDSLDRMRSSLARVGHYGTLAFAGWNIAGALPQLVSMADSVKLIDARLRLVTQSSAEFVAAQRLAYDVARETGTGFEAIAGLYTRLAMTGADYGLSAERIATVTRSTAQALKLSGASAAESASVITQLSQAMGSGVLRGEEFNSIMENGGRLASALADGLGLPIGQLRALAEQGLLTTEVVSLAIESQADRLASEAARMPQTLSGALTTARDSIARAVHDMDQSLGGTAFVIQAIGSAAANAAPVLNALALALAAGLARALAASVAAAADYIKATAAKIAADRAATATTIAHTQARVTYARAELAAAQAAVASAVGMARLSVVQRTLIPAQQALAAAQAAQTAAMAGASVAARGLSAALGLMGGPLGLILTALSVGATAWALWGGSAESAAARANKAVTDTTDALQRLRNRQQFGDDELAPFRQAVTEAQAGVTEAETPRQKQRGGLARVFQPFLPERVDEAAAAAARRQLDTATRNLAEAERLLAGETQSAARAALEKQAATKALAEQYRSLAAAAQTATDAQLAQLDTATARRLRAVDAAVADTGGIDRSRERERQITRIQADAATERNRIIERSTREQLALLDQAHAAELAAAQKANQNTAALDKSWLDSKLKALQDWRGNTAKTLDELTALEKKHRDAALATDNEIASHKRSTQELIRSLSAGADANTAASLSNLRSHAITLRRELAQAQRGGDVEQQLAAAKRVEQAYIDAGRKAQQLFGQGVVDQSTVNSVLYELQQAAQQVDAINAQRAEQQRAAADQVAQQITAQQATLADADAQLSAIIEKSKQVLAIHVDTTAIAAAKAAIEAIPAEKTVVIRTVTEGGEPIAPTASVPGFASGGRLPGFGGGDRQPALLESGEGVVNKYAMQRLDSTFGKAFFDRLNAGDNPLALLRQRFAGLQLQDGGRIAASLPRLDMAALAARLPATATSGTPINIVLPGGQSYGPFTGGTDIAVALADALKTEAMKRGTRG